MVLTPLPTNWPLAVYNGVGAYALQPVVSPVLHCSE